MTRARFLSCLAVSLVLAVAARAAESAKPNITILPADDLDRGEYSAFGTKDLRTPNIDRLFRGA